jgi:crotonobetainyl-CoA:carnitine CoA-transferase CaiB-like acyl-CoA transferase
VLRLTDRADVLVEGLRPGVAERLGVGPDAAGRATSRLVYARMTGWGQDGPLAPRVGHDLDYLAVSGALSTVGERAARRCRRSTSSATSAAARCCSSPGCSPRSSSARRAAAARSSTPRWSTASARSWP